MSQKAVIAVLEEFMRWAMEEAVSLYAKDSISEEERGELNAYFNILDWGNQQAEIMDVQYGDKELQAFDPYSLMRKKAA